MERFDRNIRFFGKQGQEKIRAAKIVIVGAGGLGTFVGMEAAYLGVGEIRVIDDEELEESNRNRYVTARAHDPVPGSRKVDLLERMVRDIDPAILVRKVFGPLMSERAFFEIRTADYVFGCLDNEGSRLVLTELCAAYGRPYFDLASDIRPGDQTMYGGRVCFSSQGNGCQVCLDVIDMNEAQRDLANPDVRRDMDAIYGLNRNMLSEKGPSVVSLNGVVASLAMTEFMVGVTSIRAPIRLFNYYGHLGRMTISQDHPKPDCHYCKGIYGTGVRAGVERYLMR